LLLHHIAKWCANSHANLFSDGQSACALCLDWAQVSRLHPRWHHGNHLSKYIGVCEHRSARNDRE
jgi:hypothetical protein